MNGCCKGCPCRYVDEWTHSNCHSYCPDYIAEQRRAAYWKQQVREGKQKDQLTFTPGLINSIHNNGRGGLR